MMLIFARNSLKKHITGVQTSEKGIGLLGFGVSWPVRIHSSEDSSQFKGNKAVGLPLSPLHV